ncbi:MAG: tetratricopeptide repeat protein, partial [Planctomycetota bacterium]|jgi:type IV pilus assembly protein PilQ
MDLADQTGVDIVKSPQVEGPVTAKVTDVPLSEALTNILAAHGFTYVATDNMIRVTPLPEFAVAGDQLVSKVYQITYADANEVAGSLARFVSEKGSVAVNRGTSHIAVTDTESKMRAVDNFVAELDQQTEQVLVEVKIYEITTEEGFNLETAFHAARTQEYDTEGTILPTTTTTSVTPGYTTTRVEEREEHANIGNWSENLLRQDNGSAPANVENYWDTITHTQGTNVNGPESIDTRTETVPEIRSTTTQVYDDGTRGRYVRQRNEPFVGGSFNRQRGGTLRFSLLDDAVDFEFALSLLKKEVESRLLANPQILVLDNEPANFEIVRKIPYRELMQVAREDPITYTEFNRDVGVQLEVTPHIARDGLIKLRITPEFGILVSQNIDGTPTVDSRRFDTTALIRDGQTIVIGGLRQKQSKIDIAKVPLLGDLPLLKGLFRSKSETEVINELVVLITPRIIRDSDTVPAELSPDGENGIPKAFGGACRAKPCGKVLEPAGNGSSHDAKLDEASPEIMMQLAYGYLKTKRFELAAEMLNSVIAKQADNATAHQYLGYCQLKLAAVDEAIGSYLKAVELNADDFEAHRGLGVAYMIKARSNDDSALAAKAIEQWQIALDINPAQANAAALKSMIEAYTQ